MAEEKKDMADALRGRREPKEKQEKGEKKEGGERKEGKEREGGKRKGEEGGKKEEGHKLREMRVRFGHKGGAIVEHHYEDKHGHPMPHKPEYPLMSKEDLDDHMAEHAHPEMEPEEGEGEDEQEEGQEQQQEPQGGGQPPEE